MLEPSPNHSPLPWSVEKLSFMKLAPGPQKVGDCQSKVWVPPTQGVPNLPVAVPNTQAHAGTHAHTFIHVPSLHLNYSPHHFFPGLQLHSFLPFLPTRTSWAHVPHFRALGSSACSSEIICKINKSLLRRTLEGNGSVHFSLWVIYVNVQSDFLEKAI